MSFHVLHILRGRLRFVSETMLLCFYSVLIHVVFSSLYVLTHVGRNELSGSIPTEIGNLRELTQLNIGGGKWI